MKPLLALLPLLALATMSAHGAMVYDITFEPPTHQAGSAPATGSGPARISSIDSGSPVVTASMPLLNGNSLEFAAGAPPVQISVQIDAGLTAFVLAFNLVSQNLHTSDFAFTVGLEGSEMPTLDFHGGFGSVYVFRPLETNTFLQPFADGQRYLVEMTVDQPADAWRIAIDGSERFQGTLGTAGIGAITFGLAPWLGGAAADPSVKAFLDNVQVTAVPEPGTAAYLLMSLVAGGRRWRKAGGRTRSRQ